MLIFVPLPVIIGTLCCWHIGASALAHVLVTGPIIAVTLSLFISFWPPDTAEAGLPSSSTEIICTFCPFTPPALLVCSSKSLRAFWPDWPKEELLPVSGATNPILIVPLVPPEPLPSHPTRLAMSDKLMAHAMNFLRDFLPSTTFSPLLSFK